jgi:phage-related protein
LVGRPTYSDRQGSFEFYVDNDYGDWASRRKEIAAFLDGRKLKMHLEDDPNYYYEGRFYFKQWTPDASHSRVTIEYRLKPYRYLSNGKEAGL